MAQILHLFTSLYFLDSAKFSVLIPTRCTTTLGNFPGGLNSVKETPREVSSA